MNKISYNIPPPFTKKDVEEVGFEFEPFLETFMSVSFEVQDRCITVSSKDMHFSEKIIPGDTITCLKRGLFRLLNKQTGFYPPYGIMTGVKPVIKVEHLLKQYDKKKAKEILIEDYFVREEKVNLLFDVYNLSPKTKDTNRACLYVQIPYCPTRCSYCAFASEILHSKEGVPKEYMDSLFMEMAMTGKFLKAHNILIDDIYIGGGTPATLRTEQCDSLFENLHENIPISSQSEITFEGGRSELLTREKLSCLKNQGVTRICINPQSLSDETLSRVNRLSDTKSFYKAFEEAKRMNFSSINTDLILGIDEKTQTFTAGLEELISMESDNITLHTLAIKNKAAIDRECLTRGTTAIDTMENAHKILRNSSYFSYYLYRQKFALGAIENTGFSKDGKECRYNQHMIHNTSNIFALGTGASTVLFKKNIRNKFFNHMTNYNYIKTIEERTKEKLSKMELAMKEN